MLNLTPILKPTTSSALLGGVRKMTLNIGLYVILGEYHGEKKDSSAFLQVLHLKVTAMTIIWELKGLVAGQSLKRGWMRKIWDLTMEA